MPFKYLLLPSRHHGITAYQVRHLQELLRGEMSAHGAQVIWAVTSANHAGTQRNPISGSRRLGMIEAVTTSADIPSQTYRITNMTKKEHFAHYLIESVRLESKGRVAMTPQNTLVISSTKAVADEYRALGYTVDSAEIDETFSTYEQATPWNVVEEIIASGAQWRANAIVQDLLYPACYDYFVRYGLGDDIVEIFQDPLIGSDDGDITETRDYTTYRQAFEDGARRKVADFAAFVQPGRILDVGSATGETLKVLSQDPRLFESDFYGVEAARPLFQLSQQRKDAAEFGTANMFFYQRNIMRSSLFPQNSVDTIITMALTHEIESYLGRDELISFLKRMYAITAPGGVYINYDVVGPHDKDRVVYALLNGEDGVHPKNLYPDLTGSPLTDFLASLSTEAKFHRFARDFRGVEGDTIAYSWEKIDGVTYVKLRHADLCDFLAKKDYNTSWMSEMHERFCYWEYSDWVAALTAVGFVVGPGSEAKQNQWLIDNRFAPAAKVFTMAATGLQEIPQPVTNALLIARKPS